MSFTYKIWSNTTKIIKVIAKYITLVLYNNNNKENKYEKTF